MKKLNNFPHGGNSGCHDVSSVKQKRASPNCLISLMINSNSRQIEWANSVSFNHNSQLLLRPDVDSWILGCPAASAFHNVMQICLTIWHSYSKWDSCSLFAWGLFINRHVSSTEKVRVNATGRANQVLLQYNVNIMAFQMDSVCDYEEDNKASFSLEIQQARDFPFP